MKHNNEMDREVVLCAAEAVLEHGPHAEIAYWPHGHDLACVVMAADVLARAALRPTSAEDATAELRAFLRAEKDRVWQDVNRVLYRPSDDSLHFASVHTYICDRMLGRLEKGL